MTLRKAMNALAWVVALALAGPAPALAQDGGAAGSFIVVAGEVKVIGADGQARTAQRGDAFRPGESIVTGTNGLAQLRMTDGSAVSVRADTQIKLDQYRFRGADDPEPSFFASLIKGGFRTITGLIGRTRRESYRVATTSATMGIRGTHFEIVHVVQQAGVAPGTYNRVYDGVISFRNRAGVEILVSRNQTAFIALPGNLAPVLVAPPTGVFGKPTPEPIVKPQAGGELEDKPGTGKAAAPRAREAARAVSPKVGRTLEPAPTTTLRSAPLLNPIDSPTISPTTTTISPTLISPTLISPTTTTISPTLISPTTTTISPTTTTISPTTTTISPTLISPTTTTISPTLISPTTTTISPTTTTISPTTTTISPTLTSPTLTSPTTTIKR